MTDDPARRSKKSPPLAGDSRPRSKFDATETNDRERMQKWQNLIDQRIRDIIGDGDVSHLTGAGHPLNLKLNDDEFTPTELRLAYKVMRDNDVVPTWMSLRYVLDDKVHKIRQRLNAYVRAYRQRQQEATQKASALLERQADQRWQSALTKIEDDIQAYNRELLDYNLTVPPQVGQRAPLNFDEEVRKALRDA